MKRVRYTHPALHPNGRTSRFVWFQALDFRYSVRCSGAVSKTNPELITPFVPSTGRAAGDQFPPPTRIPSPEIPSGPMTGYERAMRGVLIGKADGRAANARGPPPTRSHDRIPGAGTAAPRGARGVAGGTGGGSGAGPWERLGNLWPLTDA
ncbi:hypothetical protein TNCT6_33030 [Streptomyces sp. 6-11-2]|nr:hypothetical protein TNCT6_33030 [Streptomyces sp. 6-11-2]